MIKTSNGDVIVSLSLDLRISFKMEISVAESKVFMSKYAAMKGKTEI
jgi:hypothetical protein